ncbi:DNA polymerase beta-like [Neocloeon triangulifer]|uniref:DNA polymerase beta-like n=1 Tax=Neocloeon triangulifer TaxID=2078957 RepID=UPI00286F749B|nr:DNA polymerase beta-like [Neocloeon triangulifer]
MFAFRRLLVSSIFGPGFRPNESLILRISSANQLKMSCSPAKNHNKELCDMLKELAEYELAVNKNTFKSHAYKQAASTLAHLDRKISSGSEAKELKGIGDKISKKIDEYLSSGTMQKLETIRKDTPSEAIIHLSRVHGIGSAKAHDLVNEHGVTSIEQLRERQDELNLTHHQLIGLKYFEDFEKPVPREEISEVEKVVLDQVAKFDPELKVTFCGSYRRGKPESGDADILITKPSYISTCNKKEGSEILHNFIKELEKIHLITDQISLGDVKFMGVFNVHKVKGHKHGEKGTFRRVDIRVCPSDQYYCHMLHFTGSNLFNQNIRHHAHSKGYTLNEYSLRPVGTTGTPGAPVIVNSEKDIFEYLDFPYKAPEDRDD